MPNVADSSVDKNATISNAHSIVVRLRWIVPSASSTFVATTYPDRTYDLDDRIRRRRRIPARGTPPV
jgi:hypothetical protein